MHDLKKFYFSDYDHRRPEQPLPYDRRVEFVWQTLAVAAVVLGVRYIWWRWADSLNTDVLWFSVPVAIAETCAFVGMLLFFHNLWTFDAFKVQPAPASRDVVVPECGSEAHSEPVSVDVFLPTYNEDPELTRYSIKDAVNMTYPHQIDVRVHVLDDGNRPQMAEVARQEGVNYITRATNVGYKAGNLRNGMEQTTGDFIVILDSDTRPFNTLLTNTLGYFRDPDVAWVQTPQWFYDIPEGRRMPDIWQAWLGPFGHFAARTIERIIGPITFGADPFISDPKLFYDIIQRRRNCVNASFCCGAGSVHRRDAVMEAALKTYGGHISDRVFKYCNLISQQQTRQDVEDALRTEMVHATQVMPYKFHVSEDIYTSILLQSDTSRNWKSVFHPVVETKMLSPLDMQSWAMQRFKYAGGTLDILVNDNPLFSKGMTLRQKLMYAMTFWSYLTPLWTVIFIAAPIIALITGISPVNAYSVTLFAHLLPFLIIHELACAVGTWGVDNRKGRMLNLAFFSINLQAMWAVIRGREILFKVTPKARKEDLFLRLVYPQIAVVLLTCVAVGFGAFRAFQSTEPAILGSVVVNSFWAASNAWCMTALIAAALWKPPRRESLSIDVKNRLRTRTVA